MCGIIGFYSSSKDDLLLVKHIIMESQIRGKHATGISLYTSDGIITIKKPICSKEFIDKYWDKIVEEINTDNINIIGHTRYSTSGLLDNQPISDSQCSVVLNGVITQSDPNNWMNKFNFNPVGTNDTEILHNAIKLKKNPFHIKSENTSPSMASCYMKQDGSIYAFRNGSRPGYLFRTKYSILVASTKEIIKRSFRAAILEGYQDKLRDIIQLTPGIIYKLDDDTRELYQENIIDLQRNTI